MKTSLFEYDEKGRPWKTLEIVEHRGWFGLSFQVTQCTETVYDVDGRIAAVKEYVVPNPKT